MAPREAHNLERSGSIPAPATKLIREAFQAAAPALREHRQALESGALVICAQCLYFDFSADPQAMGKCRIWGDAWPFAPFECKQFERRHKKQTRVGTI